MDLSHYESKADVALVGESVQTALAVAFGKQEIERLLDEACAVCGDVEREQVAKLLEAVDEQAAWRYARCHEPGYGWVAECPHDMHHPSFYVPFSCMLRICPDCAKALAAQAAEHYEKVVKKTLQEQWHKVRWGWRLRLVTLTTEYQLSADKVDVGKRVLELLNAARDCFHELWGGIEGAGALAGVEVGPSGLKFHVHVLMWSPYPDHSRVKEIWGRLTGQAFVHLEVVGKEIDYQSGDFDAITRKSTRYVTKYMFKFDSLAPELLVSLHVALKGRRRVRAWGAFYGVKVEDEKPAHVCAVCGARLVFVPEVLWSLRQERMAAWGREAPTILLKEQISPGESPGPPGQGGLDALQAWLF